MVNPDLGTRIAVIDYLQLRNTLLLVREHSGRYHATIRFLLAIGQLLAGLSLLHVHADFEGIDDSDTETAFMIQPGFGATFVGGDGWGIFGQVDYRRSGRR